MLIQQIHTQKRKIAFLLLAIMSLELIIPVGAHALTSGPVQPESKGYEPVGTSGMVDPFTGDFSYSLPLADVDGYGLTLNYRSGNSPEDEASWVGYGWSLTPGSINRQMRGIPDDFNGNDKIIKETDFKDHVTKGITARVTGDILGIPRKNNSNVSGAGSGLSTSLSLSVEYDNYRGIGTSVAPNAGIALGKKATDENAAGQEPVDNGNQVKKGTVSLGISSSSMNGAGMNLNFSLLRNNLLRQDNSFGMNAGLSYSSRAGLQGMTLGATYNPGGAVKEYAQLRYMNAGLSGSSFISFAGQQVNPVIDVPVKSSGFSLDINLGAQASAVYGGAGLSGYYNKQSIAPENKRKAFNGYGMLYSERAKKDKNAIMDFNREKDGPYSANIAYLPVPIPGTDLFTVTGQTGGGQFRIARNSHGVFADPVKEEGGDNKAFGIEFGALYYLDIGANLNLQTNTNRSGPWNAGNTFASVGDFSGGSKQNSLEEHAYFRKIGSPTVYDEQFGAQQADDAAVAVQLSSNGSDGIGTSKNFRTASYSQAISKPIRRNSRELRTDLFSYLTAQEASVHGVETKLKTYPLNQLAIEGCQESAIVQISRNSAYRKPHHLSELTVTGSDGARSIYGIPVYNTYQEDVSFSVPEGTSTAKRTGLVSYNAGADDQLGQNKHGRENYVSRHITPAYATSYLISAVLSPDYADVKGDGITDDDKGTAVKFNYYQSPGLYHWRTPYGDKKAGYHEGQKNDNRDDKANYSYGTREQWYLHSVESKTTVALFILADREDGLGVVDRNGGKNTTNKLKMLKEIRLYSKADVYQFGADTAKLVPFKTVHFEYDYSLMPGIPNSSGVQTGKLTLKKIYFSYYNNLRGAQHPYTFEYNDEGVSIGDQFSHRMYDRWGNYKNPADNPGGMTNAEFPYTLSDQQLNDAYVARWQLKKINLPTGGSIEVDYESDDYAFVQDRKAMQMLPIAGIGNLGNNTGLIDANKLIVKLPQAVKDTAELRRKYFQNETYLFFRVLTDVDGKGHYEYVPGYASVAQLALLDASTAVFSLAMEEVEGVGAVNPVANAGWQYITTNLPGLAYPGYENIGEDGSDFKKAILSLVGALSNFKDLLPNAFPKKAKRSRFSNTIDLSKSFVRLQVPNGHKAGGGSRIRRLTVTDNWASISGTEGAKSASYQQLFSYTLPDGSSSGVASFEPMLGGEENPFHQPVFYKQNVILQMDKYYYVEEPLCESLYPGPSVGYSRVEIRNIGSGELASRTGKVVNEFYTSREFPTKVEALPLQKTKYGTSKILQILFSNMKENTGVAQGYVISNNDMHGKPKSTKVYNQTDAEISATTYYYKTNSQFSDKGSLNNSVSLLQPNGMITEGRIGHEVETFTDMREHVSSIDGVKIQASVGVAGFFLFPIPFGFPGIGDNKSITTFRASSTIKIINDFGVLEKVTKMENGTSYTTENLLWDGETGNVLLTSTQNEFDKRIYTLSLPANWAYPGMGAASLTQGVVLNGISTDKYGKVKNSQAYSNLLFPGDELIDTEDNKRYWVLSSGTEFVLTDRSGFAAADLILTAKLVRSGRRNQLQDMMATYTTQVSPVYGNKLNITKYLNVLQATSVIYKDQWNVPIKACPTCPEGYTLSEDQSTCTKTITPVNNGQEQGCSTLCEGDKHEKYGISGTLIYEPGFSVTGQGATLAALKVTCDNNPFWTQSKCTEPAVAAAKSFTASSSVLSFGNSSDTAKMKSTNASILKMAASANPSACNLIPSARNTSGWCGPLNRTSLWTCNGYNGIDRLPLGKDIGFSKKIAIPSSGYYYVGVGADNRLSLQIDDKIILNQTANNNEEYFRYWHIYPVYLTKGYHTLTALASNGGAWAALGLEIYQNSAEEIARASSYDQLSVLFTTRDLIGQPANAGTSQSACPEGFTPTYTNGVLTGCVSTIPSSTYVNPYIMGLAGNWRAASQLVYSTDRSALPGDPSIAKSTDIRTNGYFIDFTPYWQLNSQSKWTETPMYKWIKKGEGTAYNGKGLAIEEKDPLARYSSVLTGYLDSRVTAEGVNTSFAEMAFDNFEEYSFSLDCRQQSCSYSHFGLGLTANARTVHLENGEAHSGNRSLSFSTPIAITKSVGSSSQYSIGSDGLYSLSRNSPWSNGFSPVSGKKYILSFWVKDNNPRKGSTALQVSVNGNNLINSGMLWPVVEGWKRVEIPFTLASNAQQFTLSLTPSGKSWIDDFRIYPYDAQMQSYVYDEHNLRLLAKGDENNFSTFYEYDSEGNLVRVKKETERGIVTIKETRSSYSRKN